MRFFLTFSTVLAATAIAAPVQRSAPSDLLTVVQQVEGLVTDIETALGNIDTDASNLDLLGIVKEVENLDSELTSGLESIVGDLGIKIDTSELDPLIENLEGELNSVVALIQSEASKGAIGEVLDDVKTVLHQIDSLIASL